MVSQQKVETIGVILAGGKSRRMGVADKCLLPFEGKTLLEHVVARAEPQVDHLLLSANGDPARFHAFALPIIEDVYPGHCGPLAGIISAMAYASKQQPQAQRLATFPSDAPQAPRHWVERAHQHALMHNLEVVVAADPHRAHYTFALWSLACLPALEHKFAQGERALFRAMARFRADVIECSSDSMAFSNINTPTDLQQLRERE